jgi:hypothetical protein
MDEAIERQVNFKACAAAEAAATYRHDGARLSHLRNVLHNCPLDKDGLRSRMRNGPWARLCRFPSLL